MGRRILRINSILVRLPPAGPHRGSMSMAGQNLDACGCGDLRDTEPAGEFPVMDVQIAWIPGTRSLWAAGDLATSDGTAILRYGP